MVYIRIIKLKLKCVKTRVHFHNAQQHIPLYIHTGIISFPKFIKSRDIVNCINPFGCVESYKLKSSSLCSTTMNLTTHLFRYKLTF